MFCTKSNCAKFFKLYTISVKYIIDTASHYHLVKWHQDNVYLENGDGK